MSQSNTPKDSHVDQCLSQSSGVLCSNHPRFIDTCIMPAWEWLFFGECSMGWIGSGDGWALQGVAPVVRPQCRFDTGMSACSFVGKRVRRTLGRRGTTRDVSEVPSMAHYHPFIEWNNDREAARGIPNRKCFPHLSNCADRFICPAHFQSLENWKPGQRLGPQSCCI